MQRKICLFCLVASMIFFSSRSIAQQGKSEFTLGYGYYSIYSLIQGTPFNASSGASVLGYRYYITRDITLGLGLGYENISTWGSFVNVAPELTGTFLDTRHSRYRVRIYGAVSLGVTFFKDLNVLPGQADESGLKPWVFQATPFGIRIGREIAGFVEIGVGYKGLFNGGLSVRVPRHAVHHHSSMKAKVSE